MTSQSKVYISNLNYHTTEEELREYLAETKATNVFIPNYFVGFGSLRFKPLGIAYADLPNTEEAEGFIKEFEGRLFKDRKLKIKHHVPYTPSQKLSRLSSVQSMKRLSKNENDESKEENKENVDVSEKRPLVEKKYSENCVFVKGLKAKTCEEDLKEIFKDYNPTDIKIFKPRGWMRGLKHRSHNAIITLDLPKEKTLDQVISSCSGEKCCGNTIVVMKAYLNPEREADARNNDPGNSDHAGESQVRVLLGEDATENGSQEVAFVAVGEISIPIGDRENSKEGSREQTLKSYEQDNASERAIIGDIRGSDEKPDGKPDDKSDDKSEEKLEKSEEKVEAKVDENLETIEAKST